MFCTRSCGVDLNDVLKVMKSKILFLGVGDNRETFKTVQKTSDKKKNYVEISVNNTVGSVFYVRVKY